MTESTKSITRAFFSALADQLVGQGWVRDGGNHIVEKDDATVHLDNRDGPAVILITFDHFNSRPLTPEVETVEGYLREIDIEVSRWSEREE